MCERESERERERVCTSVSSVQVRKFGAFIEGYRAFRRSEGRGALLLILKKGGCVDERRFVCTLYMIQVCARDVMLREKDK